MIKRNEQPVIVTTSHRGVFFGFARDVGGDQIFLRDAKMAIYFGTSKGLHQLAHTGPTSSSRISAPADVTLRDITAVYRVTEKAKNAWVAA